ncbi:hypothetical protein [Psychroflexus salis]|uniref:YceI-like domain-containing protein n=1 Tax=Psychroflexus salis TaxID=1526574 RepID=A0A917E6D0_9FLAO|nr:hypothetical protein [Psychroflexus salis]GGE07516.1 hypothetical protein GCM10010831_06310 [Psychroflexus salis]
MKRNFNFLICLILFVSLLSTSCSVETEKHEIVTPVLELKAVGPLFEGSNTSTATWEFTLEELFPTIEGEVIIEKARITAIQVKPKSNLDLPKISKMVMEMKSKYTKMNRIGLLESNIQQDKTYDLQIADEQEEVDVAITDERITFVGDFDMLDEDFYEDVIFDLQVSFEIETRK